MYLTCKCLNVSVKTRGDELKEFDRDLINDITNCDSYCDFFQQSLATANELEGINKIQCGLVINKNIGLWCIHRCINCSMYTHAVHRNYGAGLVLINKNMITSIDDVEKLKLHPQYSSIFKIIIDYNQLNNDIDDNDDDKLKQLPSPLTKYSLSQLSNNIQLSLTNLQQDLEQAIQKEAAIIDDKIRAFTTEQYQLLEQYRERAHIEYNILSRIICRNNNNHYDQINNHEGSLKKMIINNVDTVDLNLTNESDKNEIVVNNIAEEKENKSYNVNYKVENFDCGETMFALEGMDEIINSHDHEFTSEVEGSDADDSGQDEGIHIPRGQKGHPTLAKSLPVSVPNFSTFQRQTMRESDDDQLSIDPFDPHNIRASIKALAKSVHGDAVFGDLPRPRFSTQI